MATNNFSASPVIIRQELRPHGHEIFMDFSLNDAASLQEEWTFTQHCETLCEVCPTVWTFEMSLERATNLLLVSGTAKLTRKDSINIAVRVCLEIKFRHQKFGEHIPIPKVDKIMQRHDKMIVNISNIVPNTYNYLLHEQLSAVVLIDIQNCHRPRYLERPVDPPREV